MILMQRSVLMELWHKYRQGVPVQKLISQYNIPLTPPTFTKLLMFVSAANEANQDSVGTIIDNSIFPVWLAETDAVIAKQPKNWRYEGKMPLGEWVKIFDY